MHDSKMCVYCISGEEHPMEGDEFISLFRVMNEETVLAGFPSGDRYQTLKNIRSMAKNIYNLRAQRDALAASLRELVEPDFTYEKVHSYYTVCAGQIAQTSIAKARAALAKLESAK